MKNYRAHSTLSKRMTETVRKTMMGDSKREKEIAQGKNTGDDKIWQH